MVGDLDAMAQHIAAWDLECRKAVMGLVIKTIGLARAHAAITLAHMAYDRTRWCWLDSQCAVA